ncbi:hypothetical protein DPX16_4326 [Anabarilius grahami]|uniref:Ig-like domain-containing protein n=1 Tax=Anabarilius grahami TaxID=495550 RepID=A0A3N0YSX2_ANAGA|nr:hypothetical protein DPX16_4326 [Anabarilius grahami]
MENQTGSLTIRNIRSEHTGLYELTVIISRTTLKRFIVTVYGNSLLSSISVSNLSISLSLPLEVEYQDKNTYSCVLNNPIRNQTKHLPSNGLCHTCEEQRHRSYTILAVVGVLLLLVMIPVCGGIWHIKNRRQAPQSESKEGEGSELPR